MMFNRLILIAVIVLLTQNLFAQITETRITLTAPWDQIKFEPTGEPRYFLMNRPSQNYALALYSPDQGGWYWWTERNTGNFIINKGYFGVGFSAPQAPMHIRQVQQLGNNLNDTQIISRLHGLTTNSFYQSSWLRRDASGSSWNTARLHDGISIDVSYQQPGVNTKTWWERDPYNNIQSWGTGSSAIMTLRNSRLGVGTDDPQYKLHVESDDILLKRGTGTSLHFRTDGSHSYINNMDNFVNNGSSGNGKLIITAQSDVYFRTGNTGSSGTSRMVITNSGNIGVGTETPSDRLEVYGGRLKVSNIASIINFYETDNDKNWFAIADGNNFRISQNTTSVNDNALLIKSDGNVGIGTNNTTFNYKLAVNGTIGAKEVVVENTSAWPDYVFKPEYELISLNEVEEFINQNGHLPNIPSAQEVEEEGISLGEMNRLLLEKVEELTLQLIKQNKEIELLKAVFNKIK